MRAHLFLTFAAPLALAGCLQDFGAFTPSSGGSGGGGSGGAGGTGGGGSGNQGGGGTGNQGGGGTGNQGGGGMASCGDGTVNGAEDCDGADLGGATCASQGFVSGALACSAGCTFDTSGCVSCGNGTIEGTDACDGANLGGETCISQGFDGGTLACSGSCTFDTSGCGTCGNDVQEGTEPCDGVDLAGETCVSQGFVGGTLACNGACAFDTSGCTSCGNGTIQAGEACDGNNLNGGTCASLGFVGGTLACAACAYDTSGCTNCGNGTLDAGEACDGANLNGATCASQGFASGTLACTGACAFDTSACVANPTCGNGVLEAGEACDDANMASNDGCSSGCAIEQPPNCTLTGFFLVPNGTLTLSGDTAMGPGTAPSGSCKGAVGGTRDVFALKPTANGFLTLTLPRAAATFDSVLSARTTCDSVASQVLCADSTQAAPAVNGGEMISFEVTANTIYYVVVESAGAAAAGTYDLTVDLSAGTCADPVEIVLYPPTPMVAIGNSTGDGANHQGSCGGMSAEEVTYRVRRSAAGPVTGALSGAHNLVLHARDVCADFNTEVGCSNGGGAGVTETLGPFAFPDANADAFFHCDGSGGEEGPYTLTLTP